MAKSIRKKNILYLFEILSSFSAPLRAISTVSPQNRYLTFAKKYPAQFGKHYDGIGILSVHKVSVLLIDQIIYPQPWQKIGYGN